MGIRASHGFARTQDWTLKSAVSVGSDVELKFELGPTDCEPVDGFDRFRVELTFTVGRTLTLTMTVVNEDEKPLFF